MAATPNLNDTTDEALAVQLECLRRMSPHERLRRACAWSGQVRRMAFAAIRRRHPDYSESEVRLKFIELTYGQELADEIRDWQQEQTESVT
ncbi:hypothetical protein SAMN05421753_1137 [Planctomicrobium piriforme]|uniref:Uncharacterized protein n=1 Tax=Planctomicrobium piriforme TaxID=1576369 RepID=A0A1I3LN66_9PLAN|nr:hypothetical protein SAMN05421753_1137 [Planctomicrobium piriforme]